MHPHLLTLILANTSQLNLVNPHLWWPNGYGKPDLYRIRLQYADNSGISDDTTFVFGVRTVGTKALDVNGTYRRDFYVNGQQDSHYRRSMGAGYDA